MPWVTSQKLHYSFVGNTSRNLGMIGFSFWWNFLFNIKSATSNSRSTVPIGTSNCPFATMIWKFGGGSLSFIASFASNLILLRSCSKIALVRAPVSIRPSSPSVCNTCDVFALRGKRWWLEGMTSFVLCQILYVQLDFHSVGVVFDHCKRFLSRHNFLVSGEMVELSLFWGRLVVL